MKSVFLIVVMIVNIAFAEDQQRKLYRALVANKEAEVMRLIEEGVDANYRDRPRGFTAMHWAAARNQEKIIRLLLEKGYSHLLKSENGKVTPLITAVQYGARNDIVELLIKSGSDVNAVHMIASCDPLRMAVAENNIRLVKLLLKHGANTGESEHFNHDVLFRAGLYGHHKIESLLEAWELLKERRSIENGSEISETN